MNYKKCQYIRQSTQCSKGQNSSMYLILILLASQLLRRNLTITLMSFGLLNINDILHVFKITMQSLPFPVDKRGKGNDWIVNK